MTQEYRDPFFRYIIISSIGPRCLNLAQYLICGHPGPLDGFMRQIQNILQQSHKQN